MEKVFFRYKVTTLDVFRIEEIMRIELSLMYSNRPNLETTTMSKAAYC